LVKIPRKQLAEQISPTKDKRVGSGGLNGNQQFPTQVKTGGKKPEATFKKEGLRGTGQKRWGAGKFQKKKNGREESKIQWKADQGKRRQWDTRKKKKS